MSNELLAPSIAGEILELDSTLRRILRNSWPEGWLQINLPVGSTRALFVIAGGDARTPGKVADALGVSRTTVTGLLDRLEGEGLLTRTVDPNDRRCFVLQLTPRALHLIEEIEGNRRDRLARALAALSEGELHALQTGLDALVRSMMASNLAR
jgi:DNA-binding MarR family transcriptional regulator